MRLGFRPEEAAPVAPSRLEALIAAAQPRLQQLLHRGQLRFHLGDDGAVFGGRRFGKEGFEARAGLRVRSAHLV